MKSGSCVISKKRWGVRCLFFRPRRSKSRILNRRDTNSMLTAQALVGTKRFTVADFLSAAGGA